MDFNQVANLITTNEQLIDELNVRSWTHQGLSIASKVATALFVILIKATFALRDGFLFSVRLVSKCTIGVTLTAMDVVVCFFYFLGCLCKIYSFDDDLEGFMELSMVRDLFWSGSNIRTTSSFTNLKIPSSIVPVTNYIDTSGDSYGSKTKLSKNETETGSVAGNNSPDSTTTSVSSRGKKATVFAQLKQTIPGQLLPKLVGNAGPTQEENTSEHSEHEPEQEESKRSFGPAGIYHLLRKPYHSDLLKDYTKTLVSELRSSQTDTPA